MSEPARMAGNVVGWDVGGAHVKACLLQDGAVRDIAQWPCPLWMGLAHLDAALAQAQARWPQAWDRRACHAATMTGEMADLFADRREGVACLSARLAERLGPSLRLYGATQGWVRPSAAQARWASIASANWRATAQWLAASGTDALLADIGSTTTDLIALRAGQVAGSGLTDAERLASGELVYQGVVRTPLCALAQRVSFAGRRTGVMNELFATTADVYRLTGELDAAHDQQPAADGGAKDTAATCQRLARMIGRDAHEAPLAQWVALARGWRAAQCAWIAEALDRVAAQAGLAPEAAVVGAGCGDFLAVELAARARRPYRRFADTVPLSAAADAAVARWAQVCAPAVAVALLAAGAQAGSAAGWADGIDPFSDEADRCG